MSWKRKMAPLWARCLCSAMSFCALLESYISSPVDLYLISKNQFEKNQVWRNGFLVYFKLDFYCLFFGAKNPVCWTWFLQLEFSKIKCRSTGGSGKFHFWIQGCKKVWKSGGGGELLLILCPSSFYIFHEFKNGVNRKWRYTLRSQTKDIHLKSHNLSCSKMDWDK